MSLQHLDAEHLESLKQALNNLLSTTIAEQTYAQILDGMPIASVYAEDHWFREGLPANVMQHEELCPGVLEMTHSFRSQFDILSLEFPPKILQAYQDTKFGSVAWKLRLLELASIACHNIAAYLYRLDEGVHKHSEWADWRSEKLASLPQDAHRRERSKCGPPTLFYAPLYMEPERFSNGLADVVAYWAELRIFGGIVLFDRGQTEEECNGIYIHSSLPSTLAPPTEKQFNDIVDFLVLRSPDPARCPLPLKINVENKWRWHPYRGMAEYHIYKYRQEIPETRSRTHCMHRPADWPEMFVYQAAVAEMRKKEAGEPYDEGAWEKLARVITPTSIFWNVSEREFYDRLQPDERRQGRPPYFFDS